MFKRNPADVLADAADIILCPRRTSIVETICVFGGARSGRDPRLASAAATMGAAIAQAGIRLVYGGGCLGLMGAVADAAARAGGKVIAIAPRFLAEQMRAIEGDCQAIIVPDMSIRKQLMFDYADAFVALPGGIGTIEELAEVMTNRKLERHRKPVVLANFHDFWLPWLAMIDHLSVEGFLPGSAVSGHLVVEDATEIVPALRSAARIVPAAEPTAHLPSRMPSDGAFVPSFADAALPGVVS